MTTLIPVKSKCSVCKEESEHMTIASTTIFRDPDLDSRPGELLRYSTYLWIKKCPSCGFCAPDISEVIPGADKVISSELYRTQINNPGFPETSNSFLCYSIIAEETGKYIDAGMNSLFAAWHCDDEKKKQKAIFCRSRAYALLMKAKESGQNTSGRKGEIEAIMIDILRRIGKFKEAQSLCLETIKNKPNKLIRDIINIQLMLIFNLDKGSYTIKGKPS